MSGEERLADEAGSRPGSPPGGEVEVEVEDELEPGPAGDSLAGVTDDDVAGAGEEAGAAGAEVAGPGEEVARVAAERDEYLDSLRRLQAEFENYRKRTTRQQTELLERASEAVIERLLPALDAIDLALAHVGERGEAGAGELESAFEKIGSLLRDVLAKEGLERIDAVGVAFDPTVHDAVAHVGPDEGGTGGEVDGPAVVETLRAGYRLKGRVLRPAMVKVRS